VSAWIACSERLPEHYVRVLVFTPSLAGDGDPFVTAGQREETFWYTDDELTMYSDVTHWMPLPEAPCNVKNNEAVR